MNKILSLLIAGFFFMTILLLIAGALWRSDLPQNASGDFQARPADPSAPPSDEWEIPFIPGKDDELGYIIVCQINDPAGKPLPGASAILESLNPEEYRFSSTTNEQGLSRLLILQPQAYRLIARATGFAAAEESVIVSPASPRTQIRVITLQFERQPSPTPSN